jgi:hypothetical protein
MDVTGKSWRSDLEKAKSSLVVRDIQSAGSPYGTAPFQNPAPLVKHRFWSIGFENPPIAWPA